MTETCAYKPLEMYDDCLICNGKNPDRMCYVTSRQLRQHLQQFNEVMFLDRFRQTDGVEERIETMEGMLQ